MVIGGHRSHLTPGARIMKLLTVQEVAEAMKVSEKTVRRLIKRGDLTAYKVGERGQLRVKESDFELYVEAQRVEADKPSAIISNVADSNG